MVPDGQKVWMEWTEGRTTPKLYPPTSSGENNQRYRHGGYKTFFILNSAEHEINPAHKC